ncbi:uncharacterized protein (DUF305 family) [Mycolicibacterium iranicum]|uniref:Uncharacterized protein (DUF305 family) n=1 Tax=Mycolicibacterium iranicum TaxID=912594 RepID=A0A839Q6P2_MYCIR|nr:DUF305 domain-containing protein [Mycolicibacterium iranicum]MBB2988852.1 uncharacterized protein (DUF305 family) [Mycolicibacterium iranicum]
MTPLLVRLIAALATLFVVAGCGGDAGSAGEGQSASASPETSAISSDAAGHNAADVSFATAMVAHHQQAIELSTLVAQRSTAPGLVALADQIVAVQQPEVNILNVFLVQWNENPGAATGSGTEGSATEPQAPGMVDDVTVARLESSSGPQFDRLWLESMIGQHRGGVAIADREIAEGENVDAISIAKAIKAGLTPQIGQMTTMLEGMP